MVIRVYRWSKVHDEPAITVVWSPRHRTNERHRRAGGEARTVPFPCDLATARNNQEAEIPGPGLRAASATGGRWFAGVFLFFRFLFNRKAPLAPLYGVRNVSSHDMSLRWRTRAIHCATAHALLC